MQVLPFIREKSFGQDQVPLPPTFEDRLREMAPFTLPVVVSAGVVGDLLATGTELITPISSAFLFGMCGFGALIGLITGIKASAEQTEFSKILLYVLAVPATHIVAFNSAAWRLANWWEFGGSAEEFTEARHPVQGAVRSKSGSSLVIDPFDTKEASRLPTRFDVDLINANPNAYCVTIQHRRASSGAVQVLRARFHTPELCD